TQTLHRTYRTPRRDDALCQLLHEGRIIEAQQSTSMTGAQSAAGEPALDQCREAQQAQCIGDLGTRTTDPLAELVLGASEVVEQLLVGSGFLERVQLGAVQVLQQGIT